MAIRMCRRCEGAVGTKEQVPNPDGEGVIHRDEAVCQRIIDQPSQVGHLTKLQAHHDAIAKYGTIPNIPEDER